jgi:hypothetical protein
MLTENLGTNPPNPEPKSGTKTQPANRKNIQINKMNLRDKRTMKQNPEIGPKESIHKAEKLLHSNFESFIRTIFLNVFDEESQEFVSNELSRIFCGLVRDGSNDVVDLEGDDESIFMEGSFNTANMEKTTLNHIEDQLNEKKFESAKDKAVKLEQFEKFIRLFSFVIEKKDNFLSDHATGGENQNNQEFSHSLTNLSTAKIKKLFKKDFWGFLTNQNFVCPANDGKSSLPKTQKNLSELSLAILNHFLHHEWQSFSQFQTKMHSENSHFGPSPFLYFREFEIKDFIVAIYQFMAKTGMEFVNFEEMVTFADILGESCS